MSKHTPEPWALFEVGDGNTHLCPASESDKMSILTIAEEDGVTFACVYKDSDARRIVTCINACAGIADPAAEIADLKALSVTSILLDVTPGDGSGLEVYAKSVADVSDLLCKMDEEISELKRQRDELLAAVNDLYRGYVRIMEAGRDRIMDLGGQCDPVDVMERCDNTLISARSVISKANGGEA